MLSFKASNGIFPNYIFSLEKLTLRHKCQKRWFFPSWWHQHVSFQIPKLFPFFLDCLCLSLTFHVPPGKNPSCSYNKAENQLHFDYKLLQVTTSYIEIKQWNSVSHHESYLVQSLFYLQSPMARFLTAGPSTSRPKPPALRAPRCAAPRSCAPAAARRNVQRRRGRRRWRLEPGVEAGGWGGI